MPKTVYLPPAHVPIAMTIAGSDSSGGAGIQADLKVMSALGVYSTSVISTLTAQSTTAVDAIFPVSPEFVQQQIATVCTDMPILATKIGMLGTADIICAVAQSLQLVEAKNIVLDTVMVAKSGDRLLQSDAISVLVNRLIPMADIITPNIPEACDLLGINTVDSVANMHTVAEDLLKLGCGAVLVKGGHMSGNICTDVYMDTTTHFTIENPRIATHNTHGTGCALSSAIAAYLAKGNSMQQAVKNAIAYIANAVKYADRLGPNGIGKGKGPIYHFYNSWT